MSYPKEVWGNTTWYLFHGIAEKINSEHYNSCKNIIEELTKLICMSLPCPDCSKDAVAIINSVNFDTINSKDELKQLYFKFHNHVNKKLKKPQFDINSLDDKYKNINLSAIYNNFFIIYSSNSNIPQMMSASFHRQNNLTKIRNLLQSLNEYLI